MADPPLTPQAALTALASKLASADPAHLYAAVILVRRATPELAGDMFDPHRRGINGILNAFSKCIIAEGMSRPAPPDPDTVRLVTDRFLSTPATPDTPAPSTDGWYGFYL